MKEAHVRTLLLIGALLAVGSLAGAAAASRTNAAQAAAPRVCRAQAAVGNAAAVAGAKGTIADAAWIAGTWTGSAGAVSVDERWTPAADGSMLGMGRTLRGDRLASFEFVCITERGGTLVYTAMPNARTPATDFVATAIGPDGLTFENPAHDFPKLVRYARRADGRLETTVSGGGS